MSVYQRPTYKGRSLLLLAVGVIVATALSACANVRGIESSDSSSPSMNPPATATPVSTPAPPTPTHVVAAPPTATPPPGPFGDSLPYAPSDPGTAYACVTQNAAPSTLYRVNQCSTHAAYVDSHFQPYAHQGATVCYSVELNGPQSDGASTQLFTCNWQQVPEGA
jgi:hypothetical protein